VGEVLHRGIDDLVANVMFSRAAAAVIGKLFCHFNA
jgi:hypothetical protein